MRLGEQLVDKEQVISRLKQERHEFLAAIEDLSEAEITLPRAIGKWSIKDILGHIADWERHFLDGIIALKESRSPEIVGDENSEDWPAIVEAWNAEHTARKAEIPLNQIRQEFETAYAAVLREVEKLPNELFRKPGFLDLKAGGIQYLIAAIWEHYGEHWPSVAEWRREVETTEI